jgi:hypothetical protein
MKTQRRCKGFSHRYPSRCGVKYVPERVEKNLLLSALKVWETKNGIGQSNIMMHGVSMAYWPRKRKVALG